MALTSVGVQAVVGNLAGYRAGMGTIRQEAALAGASNAALARGFNNSVSGVQALGLNVRAVGGVIRSFGNEIANLGLRLTALASLPALATGFGIVQVSTEFEKEITRIATQVGIVDERFEQWRQTLVRIAPALGTEPAELARGLFAVTSSGIRDSQSAIDALVASSKAAAVGLGDTRDVARLVTSAVLTYGDANLSAAEATDQLLVAVREGNFEADKLAGSFGRVIAVAQELGVSFAESLGFVALFTRTGVPPEVAVTSLRSALSALLKPTTKARKILEEYGITVTDIRDKLADPNIGLAQTLIGLRRELSEADFADVIGQIRGLSGVLAVTSEEAAGTYVSIVESIKNSNGTLEESFEIVRQTTDFQFQQLIASAKSLGIILGDVVLGPLNDFIQGVLRISTVVREVARANPVFTRLALAITGVVAVAGPLIFILGGIISSVGVLTGAIGTVIAIFGSLLSVFGAFSGVAALVVAGFAALGTTLLATGRDILDKMDVTFESLVRRAAEWGVNIAASLAQGIIRGAIFVVQALTALGNVIADWLAPGSPPKLLPDLPEWGAGAMEEYLKGWGEADFSVFRDISRTLEQLIRSAGGDQGNIAERILGTREAIAAAIEQFRRIGTVSSEIIDRIARSVGDNQASVRRFVRAMIELEAVNRQIAEIQREINELNREYADLLDPINQRLREITDAQQFDREADRLRELQEILSDPDATPEVRERARREIEQIGLERRRRELERERDAQISAAEARLRALEEEKVLLEEQANALRELINLQADNQNILQQSLQDITSAVGGIGESVGEGISSALGDGFEIDPEGLAENLAGEFGEIDLSEILEDLEVPDIDLDGLLADLEAAFDDFKATLPLDELETALDQFSTAWAAAFIELPGAVDRAKADIRTAFDGIRTFIEGFATLFRAAITGGESEVLLQGFLNNITLPPVVFRVIRGIGTLRDTIVDFVERALANPIVQGAIRDFREGLQLWGDTIATIFGGNTGELFREFIGDAVTLTGKLIEVGVILGAIFVRIGAGIFRFLGRVARTLAPAVGVLLDSLLRLLNGIQEIAIGLIDTIIGAFTLNQDRVIEGGFNLSEGLLDVFRGLLSGIVSIVGTIVLAIIGAFVGLGEIIVDIWNSDIGQAVRRVIGNVFNSFIQLIRRNIQYTGDLFSRIPEFFSFFTDSIGLLGEGFSDIFDGFRSLEEALSSEDLQGALAAIGNIAFGVLEILAGLAFSAAGLIFGLARTLWTIVRDNLVDPIIGLFQRLYNDLIGNSILPDLSRDSQSVVRTMSEKIVEFIAGLVPKIKTFLTRIYLKSRYLWWPRIKDAGIDAIQELWEKVSTGENSLFQTGITAILDLLRDKLNAELEKEDGPIQQMVEIIKAGVASIGQAIIDDSDNWVPRLIDWFFEVGAELARGLIDGIRDRIPGVGGAGEDAGEAATEGTERAGDMRSPSRVMHAIGQGYAQGFVNGIMEEVRTLESSTGAALSGLATSTISPLVSAEGLGDRNVTVTNNQTINGALDAAAAEAMLRRIVRRELL